MPRQTSNLDRRTNDEQSLSGMQTISVPYACKDQDRFGLDALRRVNGAAVRTAYANASQADGTALRQRELRDLVKARFHHLRIADA